MSSEYVATAVRLGWLLRSIEQGLSGKGEGEPIWIADARAMCRDRVPSEDQLMAALSALCALGVLENCGSSYSLNRSAFEGSEEFRKGVHAVVETTQKESVAANAVELCLSIPPGLDQLAMSAFRGSSRDLRGALLDIITSAKRSLVLASPFWDYPTTAEIAELVRKRLRAGVSVELLGRFGIDLASETKAILRSLALEDGCSVVSWFDAAVDPLQTFHFKAASSDDGEKAYLGSANLTTASLRSRMEMGVILTGPIARELHSVLSLVSQLATPARL